ncbi:MAG: glutamate--tRNA ligase [Bacteroidales bacterium]|nr:glutamate--tRNA ligase [Bacteroidales bacterium]
MSDNQRVRVRFAPSPTGPLHIGGVRTALYNYLFAKQQGGDFILRIEDTDSQRFVPGAETYIIDALNWLGIHFDEGVGIGGPHAPYRQSERKALYRQYIDQLLAEGRAYLAFDTAEELAEKRASTANFQYDATTRLGMNNALTLSPDTVKVKLEKGEPYVVRFLVEPGQTIVVTDLIRGEVSFNSSILDDKVLFKSADQLPTYHLANIVDDHLMEISHVIRGEEWLPSAPLHVLLYKAFGWEDSMPAFAHLPLLLKPDGNGKLSKRDGDRLGFPVFPCDWIDPQSGEKSSGYRESGYFPEAVVNFLALLGWNPGNDQEILSMNDLIEQFSLDRCSKSGARFDYEKGKWFNHQYLQQRSGDSLTEAFLPILQGKGVKTDHQGLQPDFSGQTVSVSPNYIAQALDKVKMRATFVNDLWEQASFYFERPSSYQEKTVHKYWKPETAAMLTAYCQQVEAAPVFTPEPLEAMTNAWIADNGYKSGLLYNALRLALVGEGKGPHLFDIAELLGKEETLFRIKRAIDVLH